MSDRRLFEIFCMNCQELLVTVPLIREPEIVLLEAHIRACWSYDPLPAGRVMLGQLLRRVRVSAANQA